MCSVFFAGPPESPAADADKKLYEIQEKLKSKLDELKETTKKEESVTQKLEHINRKIKKKEQALRNNNRMITKTETEIGKLSDEIRALTVKLESNMQYLQEVIIAYYKQQYDSNALILLSADDYHDMIQKMKYASLIAHYDSKVINDYSSEIERIFEKKNELEALKDSLRENKTNIRNMKARLSAEGREKDQLLASLKAKRDMYEKKIKELEKASSKVQGMLKGIKSKKLPASIVGKGFPALKGRMPWPVAGELLRPYGKNKKIESNTSALRSGIEIKAAEENDVPEAVAGGRVVYTGSLEGYGNMVIIDHGSGYHSLYGNLSKISLENGDIVIQGIKVGDILASNKSDVPSLYFEIRYRGRPVNPMHWLTKKKVKIRLR